MTLYLSYESHFLEIQEDELLGPTYVIKIHLITSDPDVTSLFQTPRYPTQKLGKLLEDTKILVEAMKIFRHLDCNSMLTLMDSIFTSYLE